MKKIGIMGTESTGKTSFALRIQKNLCQSPKFRCVWIDVLEELSRTSLGLINEGCFLQNQMWIHHSQYASELKMKMAGVDILICDRTILDSLVYGYQLGYYDFVRDNIKNAIRWLDTYDILYFKRPLPGVPCEDDGVRSNNPVFRKDIDDLFKYYINKYSIDVQEIY